jgi:hypothetical protein
MIIECSFVSIRNPRAHPAFTGSYLPAVFSNARQTNYIVALAVFCATALT